MAPGRIILLLVSLCLLWSCSGGSGDPVVSSSQETDPPPQPISQPSIRTASTEEIEAYLKSGLLNTVQTVPFALPGNPPTLVGGAGSSPGAEDASSSTNVQEEGVDEADTVRFDGQYLYMAEQPQMNWGWGVGTIMAPEMPDPVDARAFVRVLLAESDPPGTIEKARITLSQEEQTISGLYLYSGAGEIPAKTLVIMARDSAGGWDWGLWCNPWAWQNGKTTIALMDVTVPENAVETWKITLDGHLVSSRRIDDRLYVVTRHAPSLPGLISFPATTDESGRNRDLIQGASLESLLPTRVENGGNPSPLVSPSDCYLSPEENGEAGSGTLITITAINLASPANPVSTCIGTESDGIYASLDAVYITRSTLDETRIHKFALTEEGPQYRGTGTVPGHTGWRNPVFRLGEKDGILRVVTTRQEPSLPGSFDHRLTLLKESAETPGTLSEIAHLPNDARMDAIGKPGEDIHAVRFLGERGYVVTFRQIDPLYILDLANPEDPRIAGKIEVPGFSEYLHPIGDGYLLGVGQEVVIDPEGQGWQQGVKIGLFDVSDPQAPFQVQDVVIGRRGSWCDVWSDHHAFTILPGTPGTSPPENRPHRLAVPVQVSDMLPRGGDPQAPEQYYEWSHTGLYLFEVNESGNPAHIVRAGAVISNSASDPQPQWGYTQRSFIQGPAVHYISGGRVWSALWSDPDQATGPQ